MRTVLIIGADFAPSSLPPATRIRFFANYLSEFDWHPIVLTSLTQYYDWQIDAENERLLPDGLEVIRTHALSSRWTRKVGFGDIGMRTLWHHWRELKRICRQRKIDLIFIPVPPYVPMILGRLAYLNFGIPYVIDYIDPWVTEYYNKLPRGKRPPKWVFANALSRILEPYSLKHVTHITGVSKGTTDHVIQRYLWLSETHCTTIPYGAEVNDFDYIRQRPRQNPIFNRFDGIVHLSCVGACIPGMHAAVRALFQAVRRGLEKSPDKFEKLRLHFVGTSYYSNQPMWEGVMPLAREAGIETYVDEHPQRIPYLESLQVMLDSSALVFVGSEEPHYTASKVFAYILANRPLLAIFHEDSSVVRILRETNIGHVITFSGVRLPADSVEEISTRLEQILHPPPNPTELSFDKITPYTARAMTKRLINAFNGALENKRLVQNNEGSKSEVQKLNFLF